MKCAFGVVQEILLLILLFGVSQLAYIYLGFVVGLAHSGKDIVLRFIIEYIVVAYGILAPR